MATQEERLGANHVFYDVTINELQQLTDLHNQTVILLYLIFSVQTIYKT